MKNLFVISIISLLFLTASANLFAKTPPKIISYSTLWESFYKDSIAKFGKIPKISIYCTNEKQTEIMFILDGRSLYLYKKDSPENSLKPLVHSKGLIYSTINRITYTPGETIGFYTLWYNNKAVLNIGS